VLIDNLAEFGSDRDVLVLRATDIEHPETNWHTVTGEGLPDCVPHLRLGEIGTDVDYGHRFAGLCGTLGGELGGSPSGIGVVVRDEQVVVADCGHTADNQRCCMSLVASAFVTRSSPNRDYGYR